MQHSQTVERLPDTLHTFHVHLNDLAQCNSQCPWRLTFLHIIVRNRSIAHHNSGQGAHSGAKLSP